MVAASSLYLGKFLVFLWFPILAVISVRPSLAPFMVSFHVHREAKLPRTCQKSTYITYQPREHCACLLVFKMGNKRVSSSYRFNELIHRKHPGQCPAHSKLSISISCYYYNYYMQRRLQASCFLFSTLPDDCLGRRETDRPGFKFCLGCLLVVHPWESHFTTWSCTFPIPGCSEF